MSSKENFIKVWEYLSSVILFFMMMGLAATLQLDAFKARLKHPKGILVTMVLQFFLMPCFCWMLSVAFELDENLTIALITVGCCPGGALSNVLCYVFKADVTLSIAMTACSSLVSIGMLPLNSFIYIKLAGEVSLSYDWLGMVLTTLIVIAGTLTGLYIAKRYPGHSHHMDRFARVNMWLIIIGTIVVNNISGGGLFRTTYQRSVYLVSILPSMFGCGYGILITTLLQFPKPSRLAVAVECGLQNQILALSILTLTIKDTEERAKAYAIPILYAAFSLIFCVCVMAFFLRMGWTESKEGTTLISLLLARLQRRSKGPDEEKQSLHDANAQTNQIIVDKIKLENEIVQSMDVEMQETVKTSSSQTLPDQFSEQKDLTQSEITPAAQGGRYNRE